MSETSTAVDPGSGEIIFPATSGKRFIYDYYAALPDLAGKTVVDIPCGDGRASHIFRQRGANVIALDLFPKFMKAPGITAGFADLRQPLPLADASADYVVCQEGIEHIPDPLAVLCEFNRVLKPGGTLVITCPSISHARARVAMLLLENESWRRMPPSLVDTVWVAGPEDERVYFGHLFLLTVQRLATLCGIAGFRVTERRRTDIGASSVLLGVLLYPLFALASLAAFRTHARKQRRAIPAAVGRPVWWEQLKLNLAPTTLFCKHVFWVAVKECAVAERRREIRGLHAERFRKVAG